MWLVWLVFCDCGFHSVCLLMENIKRLLEASWWERLTEGKTGSCLMGRAMLTKSWIQFSVDGQGCVPSLLFDLRPNYGGGNEHDGDFLQKVWCTYCYMQCPWPCNRPPPTHASSRDSWTLMGKSVSVSCGVTAHFSWSWCAQGFLCALQESVSQSCVSSGGSMVGLMVTSSKRAYVIPRSAAPRAPAPAAGHCWPIPLQDTLNHSKSCLAQTWCSGHVWCFINVQ